VRALVVRNLKTWQDAEKKRRNAAKTNAEIIKCLPTGAENGERRVYRTVASVSGRKKPKQSTKNR